MSSVLGKSKLLVLNQVVVRLVTFLTNVFVVRHVGAVIFGLASVNLFVLYTSIIVLSQEGMRKATMASGYGTGAARLPSSRSERATLLARSHNVAWLSFPLSLAVGLLGCFLYLGVLPPVDQPAAVQADYTLSVWLHALAAAVEALAAPLYMYSQRLAMFEVRVYTEAPANVARSAVTLVAALLAGQGLLAFTYGQLAYSVLYTAAYYAYFYRRLRLRLQAETVQQKQQASLSLADAAAPLDFDSAAALFPRPCPAAAADAAGVGAGALSRHFDAPLLSLWVSFASHCVAKLLVQEGGNMLLVGSAALPPEAVGVAALVNNLGSIPVRMLFLPLEEAGAVGFSQAVRTYKDALAADKVAATAVAAAPPLSDASKPALSASPAASAASASVAAVSPAAALDAVAASLCSVTRTVTLVGAVFLFFGPPLTLPAIDVLYGPQWSRGEAPSALGLYCGLVLALAVNGVGEAFVNAAAGTQAELNAIGRNLVLHSAGYLACSALFLRLGLGARGQVAATLLSMLGRGAVAFATAHGVLVSRHAALAAGGGALRPPWQWWRAALPSRRTCALLAASAGLLWGAHLAVIRPLCAACPDATSATCWCNLADVPARAKLLRYSATLALAGALVLAVAWSAAKDAGVRLAGLLPLRRKAE